MMVYEENDELKKIIREKDIHISALIEENNKLIHRLQFLEDIQYLYIYIFLVMDN